MPSCQSFQFETTLSPALNFAMQQNHVPVIRRLVVLNLTNTDQLDITLRISSVPAFARAWEKQLAALPAQMPLDVGLVDLQPDADYLSSLTERLGGELVLELLDASGNSLHRETRQLSILAFDEWGGLTTMPEMLCAFATPNSPAIAPLLQQAARHLQDWTGDPSLDGYQSQNPNRIRQQAAAIYAALQARQIVYCLPPASFENVGQRVRLADAVLSQQMGTCLDLSILYASCLEATGLNALLAISKGHAFAGVWLNDQCFSESIQDDVSALEKRIAAGMQELMLIETTAVTAGKQVSFEAAEKLAAQHLRHEDDFICAIDLRRSRASGIRPLPQRILTAEGWRIDASAPAFQPNQQPRRRLTWISGNCLKHPASCP
jgi:hypothetical protein